MERTDARALPPGTDVLLDALRLIDLVSVIAPGWLDPEKGSRAAEAARAMPT